MTVAQAAELLGVSTDTVYAHAWLFGSKRFGRWVLDAAKVRAYAAELGILEQAVA